MSFTDQGARRKRVNLLKKLILVLFFTMLLVPILLCVILSTRLHNMESDMQEMRQLLEQISTEYSKQEDSQQTTQVSDAHQQIADAPSTVETVQQEDNDSLNDLTQTGTSLEPQDETEENVITNQMEASNNDAIAETTSEEQKTRKVYLTFDDGPSSTTAEILDILAEYGVKATFFVVGKEDEESQAVLKRIVEEGHTLGMHSYSHVYDEIYSSTEGFASDLGKLQGYLYDVTGVTSTIYRFPGGSSNKVSSTDIQVFIQWLKRQGIEYYDWNISSGDANPVRLTADQVLANCTKDLSKYHNVIILMHDAPSKKTTVEALPRLIEQILAMEDTVILPITEDTKPVQHITIKEETED